MIILKEILIIITILISQCGHLLAFCESEFCSENLRFVMEVDRLRDYMQEDKISWNRDWRTLDRELKFLKTLHDPESSQTIIDDLGISRCGSPKSPRSSIGDIRISSPASSEVTLFNSPTSSVNSSTKSINWPIDTLNVVSTAFTSTRRSSRFVKIMNRRPSFAIAEHSLLKIHCASIIAANNENKKKKPWPSKIVDQRKVENMVKKIWDTFLSDASQLEICVSPLAIINTVKRIAFLDLYGPDVFAEALNEPLRTIQLDTLPRFFASKIYFKMESFRINSIPLPSADTLDVKAPPKSSLLNGFDLSEFGDKLFNLNELLMDDVLYTQFLTYLQSSFRSENLLCVRAILIFEEHVTDKNYSEALQLAWNICNYFVLPGSAYEVSLLYANRKEILLSLARPNIFMFAQLKRTAIKSLQADFDFYAITEDYKNLSKFVISKKKREESFFSFFGLLSIQ